MNKTGLFILGIAIGAAAGIVAGKQWPTPGTAPSAPPDVHQYYYRLNDSTIARHVVTLQDSSVTHRVDTIALDAR